MERMVRYLTPQLRRTYDAVVRTLMPWRMIDALSALDENDKRTKEQTDGQPREARDDDEPGSPPTAA